MLHPQARPASRPVLTLASLGPVSLVALALVALALVAPAGGCGESHRRPGARKHSSSAAAPIVVKVAATEDTRGLLARLRALLEHGQPPLVLEEIATPAPLVALARGEVNLVLDSEPPTRGHGGRARGNQRAPIRALLLGAETLAVLANATNPMDRLSLHDLKRVMCSGVRGWRELHGPRIPLVAYTLGHDSDLTAMLRRRFCGKGALNSSVRRVRDVATLVESVRRTPGALGLLATYQIPRHPVGKLTPPGIKMLALSRKAGSPGYLATDRAAAIKGSYPLLLPITLLVSLPTDHPAHGPLLEQMKPEALPHLSARLGLLPLTPESRERTRRAWVLWSSR